MIHPITNFYPQKTGTGYGGKNICTPRQVISFGITPPSGGKNGKPKTSIEIFREIAAKIKKREQQEAGQLRKQNSQPKPKSNPNPNPAVNNNQRKYLLTVDGERVELDISGRDEIVSVAKMIDGVPVVRKFTKMADYYTFAPINLGNYTPRQLRAREFALKELEQREIMMGTNEQTKLLRKYLYQRDLSVREIYENAIDCKYYNLRKTHYEPIRDEYNLNIDELADTPFSRPPQFMKGREFYNSIRKIIPLLPEAEIEPQIFMAKDYNWIYRAPKTYKAGKPDKYRISLNVLPDKELILALDNVFVKEKVRGFYKMPKTMETWADRHDPITIYLQKEPSEKFLDEIVKITKPYIRSEEDVLIGQKKAPGVALDIEPSDESLKNLVEKARKYDEVLALCLEERFKKTNKTGFTASTGLVRAAEDLLDFLDKAEKQSGKI